MRIVGDWGSTRLRLYLLDAGRVIERREGPGIKALIRPHGEVIAELTRGWTSDRPLRLCGMVGARGGWAEMPYAQCLVGPLRLAVGTVPGHDVEIVHGVRTRSGDRADVMRGEETQIAGALVLHPHLAEGTHTLVLPGTHSKWARIEDGHLTDFRTIMTGEVYALLVAQSLLVGGDGAASPVGFIAGLAAARHGTPLTELFAARTAQLIDGRDADWARGFLSGLLIGSEVAEGTTWSGSAPVTLIGASALLAHYTAAFADRGAGVSQIDGDDAVVAGLAS